MTKAKDKPTLKKLSSMISHRIAFKEIQMHSGWWGLPREINALLDLRHLYINSQILNPVRPCVCNTRLDLF